MGFWRTFWQDTKTVFRDGLVPYHSESAKSGVGVRLEIDLTAALLDLRNHIGSWSTRCESQVDADMIRIEFNDWYTNKLLPLSERKCP